MIRINKDNIEFNRENFEDIKKGWKKKEEATILYYLYDKVVFGEDVTFKRIFDLIILHKDILNQVLGWGAMHGHTIDMFIDEYKQPSENETDIDYLEISWVCEYYSFDNVNEVILFPSIQGVGNLPERNTYSIGFTPINKLKNLKVKLNNQVKWQKFIETGITLSTEGRFPVLMEGVLDIKLIDVFAGILYEMTFYGEPKNRQKVADDLKATSDRIDNGEEDLYELEGWDDKNGPQFRKLTEEEKNILKKDNSDEQR
jgi:hypothetical protein